MKLFDCYRILNIDEDCSDLQVRSAYRRKAKLIHPDKFLIEDGLLKFNELNQAYKQIISHRKKLNKLKSKIWNQYQRKQQKVANNMIPLFQQMQQNFQSHMKTLDHIQQKLKKMKNNANAQSTIFFNVFQ